MDSSSHIPHTLSSEQPSYISRAGVVHPHTLWCVFLCVSVYCAIDKKIVIFQFHCAD